MFKKVFLVLTLGIFLFSVSEVWAGSDSSEKVHPKETTKIVKKTRIRYHWFTGTVKSVDTEHGAITIEKKTRKGTKKITVITGKKTGFVGIKGLSEVKPGERLSIKYKVVHGKKVAVRVVKKTSKKRAIHKAKSVKEEPSAGGK